MGRTLFALSLLALAMPASAAPLTAMTQGYLVDSNGDGLSGTHTLLFTLYDDAAGTTAYWSEIHDIDFTDGTYAIILGNNAPLEEDILQNYPVFLGLAIDGTTDMQPRMELASVPFSILSETAYNVKGGVVEATQLTIGDTVIDSAGISVNGQSIVDANGSLDAPIPDLDCAPGQVLSWDEDVTPAAWVCTDEEYSGSPASSITNDDLFDWNEAHGWGNHGSQGYLKSESDPVFNGAPAAVIADTDIAYWDRAVVTDPDDPAPVITGTMVDAWDFSSGTSPAAAITDQQIVDWDTAFAFFTDDGGTLGIVDGSLTLASDQSLTIGAETVTEAQIDQWDDAWADWDTNQSKWNDAYTQADFDTWAALATNGSTIDNWDLAWKDWDTNKAKWNDAYTQADFNTWAALATNGSTIDDWDLAWKDWDTNKTTWNGAVQQTDFDSWATVSTITGANVTAWTGAAAYWGNDANIGSNSITTNGSVTATSIIAKSNIYHDRSVAGGGTSAPLKISDELSVDGNSTFSFDVEVDGDFKMGNTTLTGAELRNLKDGYATWGESTNIGNKNLTTTGTVTTGKLSVTNEVSGDLTVNGNVRATQLEIGVTGVVPKFFKSTQIAGLNCNQKCGPPTHDTGVCVQAWDTTNDKAIGCGDGGPFSKTCLCLKI